MRTLVFAGLSYYRGVHVLVVLGVAVAVSVLAGALVVGGSVRTSLRELALDRLGNTQVVTSSSTYFREQLARDVGGTALITMAGAVVHDASGRTAAQVQVFGIDDAFVQFHGVGHAAPQGREAWISEALAEELQARAGDALLLRVAKPTDIPLGSVQGRRDDAGERIRVNVARIARRDALGEFALSPAQGPALTIFVPIDRLQADLDSAGRVNALLTDGRGTVAAVEQRIRERATLDDYGLRLRPATDGRTVVVESRAGVMSSAMADVISEAIEDVDALAEPVLVHLANTIKIGDREIPYSVVAGRTRIATFALNEWAANDLDARPGDIVDLDYYVWSDASGLETRHAQFTLGEIIGMDSGGGDSSFTPDYPGLTDAADVSGWDPPFPMELRRVRPIDEEYWDKWRASPKAFVPLEVAQRLWATAHGGVSSLRATAAESISQDALSAKLAERILQQVDPAIAGFVIRDARTEALASAEGTTDFGEYFVYFSFFLVVSGLLLAALFFALGIEQRAREVGILGALGFSRRDITRLLVAEATVLAVMGSLVGMAGAIGYAALIMHGLRTWWRDAVGTTALALHVDWPTLLVGTAAALLAATVALALSLRAVLAQSPRALLGGVTLPTWTATQARGVSTIAAVAMVGAATVLAATALGFVPQVAGFFIGAGFLMIAGLAIFSWWLRRPSTRGVRRTVVRFGADYARWRPTRSVLSAALITFACFVIVSVGAFRREGHVALDRKGGTGGFVLMAEAVAPLMHNPNANEGRAELGFEAGSVVDRMQVARFRLRPGDDASCLTLYQPRNPRIIAPEDAFLEEGRFTFAASLAATPEERANPWRLLNRRFADGAIPAIADQTSLTYVFHLKVGDDYVLTSDNGRDTRLRIVGALADSMLQSEIIIPERAFIDLFPRREGYGIWLIDAAPDDAPAIATTIEGQLSDLGLDATDTRARLQSYHRVENTYLSTFQALGGLGLLLGTLGLAAVLARNVIERRRELGLLQAVGFTPRNLRTLVLAESLLLVGTGLVLGTTTAMVAVMPAVVARTSTLPIGSLALLLTGVVATAVVASVAATQMARAAAVVTALRSE